MGWQEELSALDEALAAGRITPDQHRSRRDELLAAASGGGPAPMRWQASQPSDPEQTGIIRTNQFSDPEQTQKVRPVGFPPSQQQQQQFPPPWGEQNQPRGMPGMHGPEVFDSGAGKSPKVAVYVLIGVLAFVVIGGGVFWFGLNGGMGTTDTATSSPATSAPAAAPGPPADLGMVPEPPGKANAKNGEYTLAKAKDAKILSDKDVKALEAAGVDKIYDKSSTDSGLSYAVAVYVTKDAESAKKLSSTLVDNQVAAGMSTVEQIDVPESVSLMKLAVSDQFMYRGIYTSGPVTVRVATAGPSTIPDQDVAKKFNEFVQKVLGTVKVG